LFNLIIYNMSLEQLISTLKYEMEQAETETMKFNIGNKAAGTRLRKHMQTIKNTAQDVRKEVQTIKNS
tara:strand:+ start:293 stop:496 length:204 start_codon:yes stop_codon:yes gene_type:complete